MEEFQTASGLLSAALERYINACSAMANCYDPGDPLQSMSRAISDLIPGELQLNLSYRAKLEHATALLNQTRNVIPTIAPVNILPPDILAHIFQLILDAQPRYSAEKQFMKPFPLRYPDILSHVSSRWRRIAISSRRLWTRIDIPFRNRTPSRALLVRAELFSARSDPSTLDLYIGGRPDNNPPDFGTLLASFCASVAPRVKSLNLSPDYLNELYFPLLQSLFPNCMPRTLTELVINSASCFLIGSSETSTGSRSCIIDMSNPELEECLAPVSVLRLTDAYFDWRSMAYRGLVELHLHLSSAGPDIPLSTFWTLLHNNPGLRVLDLDFRIVNIVRVNAEILHISLNNLEVLSLRWMKSSQYETLLQFLYPGTKPLRLSLQYMFAADSQFSDGLTEFLARSNLTELYIQCPTKSERYSNIVILKLLNSLHLPHLRTLSLAGFVSRTWRTTQLRLQNHEPSGGAPDDGHELGSLPTFSQLDSLHLTQCNVLLDHLEQLVKTLRLSTLTLAGCPVSTRSGIDLYEREVTKAVPMVRFLSAPEDLREWDPWSV